MKSFSIQNRFVEMYELIEASRKDIQRLKNVREILKQDKYAYPLIHLKFLVELLNSLIKESVAADLPKRCCCGHPDSPIFQICKN